MSPATRQTLAQSLVGSEDMDDIPPPVPPQQIHKTCSSRTSQYVPDKPAGSRYRSTSRQRRSSRQIVDRGFAEPCSTSLYRAVPCTKSLTSRTTKLALFGHGHSASMQHNQLRSAQNVSLS